MGPDPERQRVKEDIGSGNDTERGEIEPQTGKDDSEELRVAQLGEQVQVKEIQKKT